MNGNLSTTANEIRVTHIKDNLDHSIQYCKEKIKIYDMDSKHPVYDCEQPLKEVFNMGCNPSRVDSNGVLLCDNILCELHLTLVLLQRL